MWLVVDAWFANMWIRWLSSIGMRWGCVDQYELFTDIIIPSQCMDIVDENCPPGIVPKKMLTYAPDGFGVPVDRV